MGVMGAQGCKTLRASPMENIKERKWLFKYYKYNFLYYMYFNGKKLFRKTIYILIYFMLN